MGPVNTNTFLHNFYENANVEHLPLTSHTHMQLPWERPDGAVWDNPRPP